MGKGTWIRERDWIVQVAVAMGYALTYTTIHPYSDAIWSITSGLRFTCLLLIPYRYWIALAIGEAVPLTYTMFQCVHLYGYATTLLWSFPPIVTAMPVIWLCRRYLRLFPAKRVIDMKALLICAFSTALVWTAVTYIGLSLEIEPEKSLDHVGPIDIATFFIGDYIAILAIATWPLFARIAYSGTSLKAAISSAFGSPITHRTAFVALPSVLLISTVSMHVGPEIKPIIQMTLFAPVWWISLRYGWRGTAASGPLAVACVALTSESVADPIIIQTLSFVAFAITCLFLMGARITSQLYLAERERAAVRNTLRVAVQNLHQSELRLRRTSNALELTGGTVSITLSRVAERIRHLLSKDEQAVLERQTGATKNQIFRLAESIHPIAWRERGLHAALRETIGRVLDETYLHYECHIDGRRLSQFAPSVHQSIYRLACEAVVFVTGPLTCNSVKLTLRDGNTNGRRWVVLRVVGSSDRINMQSLAYRGGHQQTISAKLGTNFVSKDAMAEQAALFDGMVHVKRQKDTAIVSVLWHDPQSILLDTLLEAQPMQLWVR
jgi:two-component system, NarL family, sensor histidine kinase FusK